MQHQRSDLFAVYCRAVLHHWKQAIGGPVLAIAGLIVTNIMQWTIPPVLWLTVLLVGVSWAQFLAWNEAHQFTPGHGTSVITQARIVSEAIETALGPFTIEGTPLTNTPRRPTATYGMFDYNADDARSAAAKLRTAALSPPPEEWGDDIATWTSECAAAARRFDSDAERLEAIERDA